MSYLEEARAVGPRPVWQIVPPSDYRDRMADDNAAHPELVEGATPPGGYSLADHGGSTIPNPKLVLVTFGSWWGDLGKLQAFAQDLMTAGYLQPLADYKYGSGQGSFAGLYQGPLIASSTVTDADLQTALAQLIDAGRVPAPDASTLYALLLPDGVTVQQGGSASCAAFCGYHDSFVVEAASSTPPDGGDAPETPTASAAAQRVFYTVQPATDCRGCDMPGTQPFDDFCAVLAHEVAEACTDAIPGQGWYNDQTGMENADEWAWQFGAYGPWTVQGYQVNGVGNALNIIRYAQPSQPGPNPNPQPQPQPDCRTPADAMFGQLGGLVEQAMQQAQAAGNPRSAAWYQAGLVWVQWAQENVDAALSQGEATAGLPLAPQGQEPLDRLRELLEDVAADLRERVG
jgi:hypothetical protein